MLYTESEGDDCRRVAVVGIEGVGNTQIALEAAFKTREISSDFSDFWVPAATVADFEQVYLRIGQALQVPGIDNAKADIKLLVRTRLS
jgi:hypothetical protein